MGGHFQHSSLEEAGVCTCPNRTARKEKKEKKVLDPNNIRLFHPADSEPPLTSMQMCWIGMTEQLLGEENVTFGP